MVSLDAAASNDRHETAPHGESQVFCRVFQRVDQQSTNLGEEQNWLQVALG